MPLRERYAELGVDTDRAMERLSKIAISLHCWQGDDVGGFERCEGVEQRRDIGNGCLSRQSKNTGRASSGPGKGDGADTRQTQGEHTRNVCRDRQER